MGPVAWLRKHLDERPLTCGAGYGDVSPEGANLRNGRGVPTPGEAQSGW
jgi:hypothetical protein